MTGERREGERMGGGGRGGRGAKGMRKEGEKEKEHINNIVTQFISFVFNNLRI